MRKLFILLLVFVMGFVIYANREISMLEYRLDKTIKKCESLEKSVEILQDTTIRHDILILRNMLTLYHSIDAPVQDIKLIEGMINSRKDLWSVVE